MKADLRHGFAFSFAVFILGISLFSWKEIQFAHQTILREFYSKMRGVPCDLDSIESLRGTISLGDAIILENCAFRFTMSTFELKTGSFIAYSLLSATDRQGFKVVYNVSAPISDTVIITPTVALSLIKNLGSKPISFSHVDPSVLGTLKTTSGEQYSPELPELLDSSCVDAVFEHYVNVELFSQEGLLFKYKTVQGNYDYLQISSLFGSTSSYDEFPTGFGDGSSFPSTIDVTLTLGGSIQYSTNSALDGGRIYFVPWTSSSSIRDKYKKLISPAILASMAAQYTLFMNGVVSADNSRLLATYYERRVDSLLANMVQLFFSHPEALTQPNSGNQIIVRNPVDSRTTAKKLSLNSHYDMVFLMNDEWHSEADVAEYIESVLMSWFAIWSLRVSLFILTLQFFVCLSYCLLIFAYSTFTPMHGWRANLKDPYFWISTSMLIALCCCIAMFTSIICIRVHNPSAYIGSSSLFNRPFDWILSVLFFIFLLSTPIVSVLLAKKRLQKITCYQHFTRKCPKCFIESNPLVEIADSINKPDHERETDETTSECVVHVPSESSHDGQGDNEIDLSGFSPSLNGYPSKTSSPTIQQNSVPLVQVYSDHQPDTHVHKYCCDLPEIKSREKSENHNDATIHEACKLNFIPNSDIKIRDSSTSHPNHQATNSSNVYTNIVSASTPSAPNNNDNLYLPSQGNSKDIFSMNDEKKKNAIESFSTQKSFFFTFNNNNYIRQSTLGSPTSPGFISKTSLSLQGEINSARNNPKLGHKLRNLVVKVYYSVIACLFCRYHSRLTKCQGLNESYSENNQRYQIHLLQTKLNALKKERSNLDKEWATKHQPSSIISVFDLKEAARCALKMKANKKNIKNVEEELGNKISSFRAMLKFKKMERTTNNLSSGAHTYSHVEATELELNKDPYNFQPENISPNHRERFTKSPSLSKEGIKNINNHPRNSPNNTMVTTVDDDGDATLSMPQLQPDVKCSELCEVMDYQQHSNNLPVNIINNKNSNSNNKILDTSDDNLTFKTQSAKNKPKLSSVQLDNINSNDDVIPASPLVTTVASFSYGRSYSDLAHNKDGDNFLDDICCPVDK